MPFPNVTLDNEQDVASNFATYKLHSKAKPISLAFDPVSGHVYYGDSSRRSIMRFSPNQQSNMAKPMNEMEETFMSKFLKI